MPIANALASVAVKDLNAAVMWYEKLLGRSSSKPMPEVAEWKFDRGGGLQVYQLPQRAGAGSFTLAVSAIEEEAARLKRAGIDPGKVTTNEKVKVMMMTDPDGNHIALAEALDPAMLR